MWFISRHRNPSLGEIGTSAHAAGPREGWLAGALPGIALVSVAVMLVVLFGVLDATRRHSLMDLLVPDPPPPAAPWGWSAAPRA